MARLAQTVDLPSEGEGLVISRLRQPSMATKSRLVRMTRKASEMGARGLVRAIK